MDRTDVNANESPAQAMYPSGRYILGIPSLVTMDDDTLARWLKPVLTHYLTDPAR